MSGLTRMGLGETTRLKSEVARSKKKRASVEGGGGDQEDLIFSRQARGIPKLANPSFCDCDCRSYTGHGLEILA